MRLTLKHNGNKLSFSSQEMDQHDCFGVDEKLGNLIGSVIRTGGSCRPECVIAKAIDHLCDYETLAGREYWFGYDEALERLCEAAAELRLGWEAHDKARRFN
jgi:5'-deoxynucleotidase YfbR-like HD superfamily hydrolase